MATTQFFRSLHRTCRRRSCGPCTNRRAKPCSSPGTHHTGTTNKSSSFLLEIPYSSPCSSFKAVWQGCQASSFWLRSTAARTFTSPFRSSYESITVDTSIENKTVAFICLSVGGTDPPAHAPLALQRQPTPPHASPVSPTSSIRCGLYGLLVPVLTSLPGHSHSKNSNDSPAIVTTPNPEPLTSD